MLTFLFVCSFFLRGTVGFVLSSVRSPAGHLGPSKLSFRLSCREFVLVLPLPWKHSTKDLLIAQLLSNSFSCVSVQWFLQSRKAPSITFLRLRASRGSGSQPPGSCLLPGFWNFTCSCAAFELAKDPKRTLGFFVVPLWGASFLVPPPRPPHTNHNHLAFPICILWSPYPVKWLPKLGLCGCQGEVERCPQGESFSQTP